MITYVQFNHMASFRVTMNFLRFVRLTVSSWLFSRVEDTVTVKATVETRTTERPYVDGEEQLCVSLSPARSETIVVR